ncbi:MAG TPA: RNA methyltransferase [Chitinophagaceae bacterium]
MLVKSQVKYIQSLGQKKQRDEAGVFIAEGPKIVSEMLREIPSQVQQLYAVKEWLDANKELAARVRTIEITTGDLERISQLSTPHQVLAVIKQLEIPVTLVTQNKLTLVLDTIQDPGNMGTIIRTADWFGITQIVCSHECADMYNPKVVQSTMGSIARIKIMYTDIHAWLSSQQHIPVYAAMLEGKDVTTIEKPKEGIIIIGNESKGVSKELAALVTTKITIVQKGRAESLNAAVATGIILSYLS